VVCIANADDSEGKAVILHPGKLRKPRLTMLHASAIRNAINVLRNCTGFRLLSAG
jgi:hypothetical protein